MADEFVYFLVAGLVIIAILMTVFGFGTGFGTTGYSTGMSFGGFTSPMFVGTANFEDVETLYASFDANNFLETGVYNLGARKTTSGLMFGVTSIKADVGKSQLIYVSFDVTNTNGYGPLIIRVDGKVAVNTPMNVGNYEFSVGSGEHVEIEAGNSEWRIWAPTIYELGDIKITANNYPRDISTFTFKLKDSQKVTGARIDFSLNENAGSLLLRLNGNTVYNGAVNSRQSIYLDGSHFSDTNMMIFDALEDSKFSGRATIALTRMTRAEKDLVVDINLTQTEYNKITDAHIMFDVVDIFSPGGYSVRITNNNVELLNEYVKLELGFFQLDVEKNGLRPGLNVLTVKPLDGAAFNIQNFAARL
ncbi:MAG: hypothetical protein WC613_03545 [Candidatus Aenigmatarchaeota archaeon]